MSDKNRELKAFTVVPRLVLAAAYVIVGALALWRISIASAPVVTARAPLHINHKITPQDLETPQTAALIGKFLRHDVGQGQPVTSGIVGVNRVPPTVAKPAFAVIVRMQQADLLLRGIQDSTTVSVQTAAATVFGTVEKIDCDQQQLCAVFVSLSKAPPQSIDAGALASADILVETPPPPP